MDKQLLIPQKWWVTSIDNSVYIAGAIFFTNTVYHSSGKGAADSLILCSVMIPILTAVWLPIRIFDRIDQLSNKLFREELAPTLIDVRDFLKLNFSPGIVRALLPFMITFPLSLIFLLLSDLEYSWIYVVIFFLKGISQIVVALLGVADFFLLVCRANNRKPSVYNIYLMFLFYIIISIGVPYIDYFLLHWLYGPILKPPSGAYQYLSSGPPPKDVPDINFVILIALSSAGFLYIMILILLNRIRRITEEYFFFE